MTAAKEAYDRIQNAEYEQDDNGKEFQNDLKIVKSHFGYDPTVFDFNKMFSEFKATPHRDCAKDAPTDFSSDCIEILQAYCRMSRDLCAR